MVSDTMLLAFNNFNMTCKLKNEYEPNDPGRQSTGFAPDPVLT